MKKLFLFLAVASTSMFVSCSDDDSKENGGGGGSTAATSIVLAANVTAVEVGQPVVFTVTDNNAKVVTSSSTILVNNVEITGSTFTPTEAGSFAIKATHKNTDDVVLESNTVTITVTAPVTAEPNSIFANGQNYSVNASILVFWGGWNADEEATTATHGLWSYVMTDDATGEVVYDPSTANNYIDVEMIVPVANGSAPAPTPATTTYLDIYEVYVNGTEVDVNAQQSGTVTFGTLPSAINMPHTFASTTSLGGNAVLATNFNGNWLGMLDGTAAKPAPTTGKGLKAKLMTREQVLAKKAQFFASLKK